MKTFTALLVMVCMCGASLFAQDTDDSAAKPKRERKNVFKTIADGFAESTRTIHELNKENTAAMKESSKTNYASATAVNKGITKLKETEGAGNRFKVMFTNMGDTAKELAEEEKARRAEIKNYASYRELLEKQRRNLIKSEI